MARLSRLTLAGYPHHVIQRGNNGQAIFATQEDHRYWLDLLRDNARKYFVAVHAYVLMENHVHILATPQTVDGLPQMMQAIGRSYVRYFNAARGRTGTLWEGRYRSTVLQAQSHLLDCMAYIDLNPVRSGLVESPAAYAWSSHGHYLGRKVDKCISPHALFWAMGNTPFAREAAYAKLVREGLSDAQLVELTDATLKGWVLGDAEFKAQLAKQTSRRLSKGKAGRPAAPLKTSQ
jgi:putative transposase